MRIHTRADLFNRGGTALGGTAAFTYGQKYSMQSARETVVTVPRTNMPSGFSTKRCFFAFAPPMTRASWRLVSARRKTPWMAGSDHMV